MYGWSEFLKEMKGFYQVGQYNTQYNMQHKRQHNRQYNRQYSRQQMVAICRLTWTYCLFLYLVDLEVHCRTSDLSLVVFPQIQPTAG
jgi:hypothetical protein